MQNSTAKGKFTNESRNKGSHDHVANILMFFVDETKHIVCGAQDVYWQL